MADQPSSAIATANVGDRSRHAAAATTAAHVTSGIESGWPVPGPISP